jgi:hypothetical protein
LAITIPGVENPGEFVVLNDGCTGRSLGPGKTCSVTVTWRTAGLFDAFGTLTATGEHASATATLVGLAVP